MKSYHQYKKQFNQNGFFKLDSLFDDYNLKKLSHDFCSFANQFAKKINHKKFKKIKVRDFKSCNKFCINLENYNKDYFFNFLTLASNLFEVNNIILNNELKKISSLILDEKPENLLFQKPTILVNIPNNKRILYHWHNAKNSYPKRNKYLNLWFPIIANKTLRNGTLEVAEKSHLNNYPFLEFKGYSEDKKNALSQNLVPDDYLRKFKKKKILAKIGDCLAMHPNLLHSSTPNLTIFCSYVVVFKIWSIKDDLTLSSNIQQKYFMNDNCSGPDVQKEKN